MTESPRMQPSIGTGKAEKLRAIAAVFGEAVAARLGPVSDLASVTRAEADDPDRLSWQTNRLIRHLRDRVETPMSGHSDGASPAGDTPKPAPFRRHPAFPTLAEGEDPSLEHPAVIARMLRSEPHDIRVAMLRALPGQIARDVMRRLKSG